MLASKLNFVKIPFELLEVSEIPFTSQIYVKGAKPESTERNKDPSFAPGAVNWLTFAETITGFKL